MWWPIMIMMFFFCFSFCAIWMYRRSLTSDENLFTRTKKPVTMVPSAQGGGNGGGGGGGV